MKKVIIWKTETHTFISAKKNNYYGEQTDSRANMEIFQSEYLNLTFLNSVYLKYAIQNKKMGGWKRAGESVEYADSIRSLNAALDSEWRLAHNYHRLTDARAKKFAREFKKK